MKYKLKAEGIQLIPNYNMWSNILNNAKVINLSKFKRRL
jgi:hypothetical protein